MIARLNGKEIENNFDYYLRLVKKGIAGFIIFGGRLDNVRKGIKELQENSAKPLIISSDLEQGLGQQLEGGTLFPPAMGVASAIKKNQSDIRLLRKAFRAIALEARYAGINTIFAPVLDINTNPGNPIISTRAFGEDPETVSFFGLEMINVLQENEIISCGKHFPGHGDTKVDSHISLPTISKGLSALEQLEFIPFGDAIKQKVKMIMLGHLRAPALDSSGLPASLSEKTVLYLREKMKFNGIIITDALNMGGIGEYSEEEASLIALKAGVDILLHPSDPEKTAYYLEEKNFSANAERISRLRNKLNTVPFRFSRLQFKKNRELSRKLAKMAVKISGAIKPVKNPALIILNDDMDDKGNVLTSGLKTKYKNIICKSYKRDEVFSLDDLTGRYIIAAVFSSVKAWKGGRSRWLSESIKKLEGKADAFISFGNPYLFNDINCTKISAYWSSDSAQSAVAELL